MSTIAGETTPSPPEPRPGNRHRSRASTAVIVVLVALAVAASALLSSRPLAEDTMTESVPAADLREVAITANGGVWLTASTDDRVRIDVTRAWTFRAPAATRSITGGVLSLNGSCLGFRVGHCSVAYGVAVPGDMAVAVRALGARIEGSDLITRELEATSSGGDIVATFANRPDRVAVESSGGDIELVVPAGRYRVEAQASGGEVQVDVVQDPDAANLLIAKSSGGDIQIRRR
jgi:hypothetical protein